MEITVSDINDHKVITIEGELNLYNVDSYRAQIDEILKESPESLVINMKSVYLIDSTVIAALFATQKKVEALNGKFHLANLQNTVENIIALTGIKFNMIDLDIED